MSRLLSAVCAFMFLFNTLAFAEGVKVEDGQREFVTRLVSAQGVKGVEVRLSRELVVDDCNTRSIDLNAALVSGDGEGWFDTYLLDAYMTQTKMFCPNEEPVTKKISSRPILIKSFSNENVTGEVHVAFVFPKGFELEAVDVDAAKEPEAGEAADDAIEADEYEVYSTVFASQELNGIPYDYVVLEKDTSAEEINAESWKDVDASMIEDFNRKNEKSHELKDRFPGNNSIDNGLHIQIRQERGERFSPFDTGSTSVSRVGFNGDRTQAVVYVEHVATPESGIAYDVFLNKTEGKWKISGSDIDKIF